MILISLLITMASIIGLSLAAFVGWLLIRARREVLTVERDMWYSRVRARGESKASLASVPATVALHAPESYGDALTAERDRYRLEA